MSKGFLCPCCEQVYFNEMGAYEICEVCGWEDDPIQSSNPDYSGGANEMSLNEAKEVFKNSITHASQ